MLKIGDFSKLSLVSVKTLRYYDEMGLLKPMHVDHFTGYRYYAAEQLGCLNRILALRDLGLSLEEVGDLLGDDLPVEQMRGMLRLKQTEARIRLRETQALVSRVEARLDQLEKEGVMPMYDVALKTVPEQQIASIRRTLPNYGVLSSMYSELFSNLGQLQLQPTGPTMAIYHDAEFRDNDVDVEVAIPITGTLPPGTSLQGRTLPACRMACLLYKGTYEGLGEAYNTIMAWMEPNGYQIAGPVRENYVVSPGDVSNPAEYVTEIQVPVEQAG